MRLFDAFSDGSNSTFGQLRQVLVAVFGIGLLTTAGFVGATWLNRRGTGGGNDGA